MSSLPAGFRVRATALIAAAVLVFGVLPIASAYTSHSSASGPTPWSFGIMADTQWTAPTDPAGTNANKVADSIVDQINKEFIKRGVKFVVDTGDLSDQGDSANIVARGAAAQDLYDAGIGFFPMRGNHELNARPIGSTGYGAPIFRSTFRQTQGQGPYVFGATNFSSPVLAGSWPDDLKGLSYSFDYGDPGNDVRIVVIDPWVTTRKSNMVGNTRYGYPIADQQAWINARIDKDTRDSEHVFVVSHENLMGQSHTDTLFTGYPGGRLDEQNAFYASLQGNGVRYTIGGHDHMYQRAVEMSPDGKSTLHELIGASDSSKFYDPEALDAANFQGAKVRETSIAQELHRIGFTIVTIAGDQVTFDYYADAREFGSDACWWDGTRGSDQKCAAEPVQGSMVTPKFTFEKRDSWGYDVGKDQGKEYLFGGGSPNGDGTAHGTDYSVIRDSFEGTTASILAGSYDPTPADFNARPIVQAVDTGWTEAWSKGNAKGLASDIFTLWGMSAVAAKRTGGADSGGVTATFTLQMSYDPGSTTSLGNGAFGLATRTSAGTWVNAVDLNLGGTKSFVVGPWDTGYELGTYGVDPSSKTVWAVVNHDGAFAAANDIEPVPGQVAQP